ncbi:hypothetical protein NUU61_006358 [Penicillium alfredii]|uniref:Uncharacterized protein n=1 Tax=Penicillium alfredii TaxID=1506179 RepID=A0A9W9F0S4_9EURO|nr:uncharacterized protein NUU61_006358 [Penicillium alfredii]KAJ5091488.1 hypothetical protein NUU61_006358 [Penicillium alfredii]
MPRNDRISPTSKLPTMLIPRPPRLIVLPLHSLVQPAAIRTPGSFRNYSLFKAWKGTTPEENSVNRGKEGDTNDPSADATATGMKEREVNEGIADETKSQGTTERGGHKYGERAKKEFPNAPEPVIGMNDERARKGD